MQFVIIYLIYVPQFSGKVVMAHNTLDIEINIPSLFERYSIFSTPSEQTIKDNESFRMLRGHSPRWGTLKYV
jgi:hypothetical protein